jgi:hypothetical protein
MPNRVNQRNQRIELPECVLDVGECKLVGQVGGSWGWMRKDLMCLLALLVAGRRNAGSVQRMVIALLFETAEERLQGVQADQ